MRRPIRTLAAVLLLAGLALGQTSTAGSAYAELFLRGQAALDRGDLDQAEGDLQRAFALEPASVPCAYALSCVAARRNEAEVALSRLNHAVHLGFLDADLARWDSDLTALHEMPEFLDCIERIAAGEEGPRCYLRSNDSRSFMRVGHLGPGHQPDKAVVMMSDGSFQQFDLGGLNSETIELDKENKSIYAPEFSEDGSRAVTQQEGGIRLWRIPTAGTWELLEEVDRVQGMRYSITGDSRFDPGGERFACAWRSGQEVQIRRSKDGSLIERVTLPDHKLTSFAWGKDAASWIASTSNAVVLIHRIGEKETQVFPTPSSIHGQTELQSPWSSQVALSPGGEPLVVGSGDGALVVFSYPELELLRTLLPSDEDVSVDEVHFDASGELLLVSTGPAGRSHLWDTRSWNRRWIVGHHFGNGSTHHSRWTRGKDHVLAFGQSSWKARVIEVASGDEVATFKNEGVMQLLDLSSDYPLLARAENSPPREKILMLINKRDWMPSLRVCYFQDSGKTAVDSLLVAPTGYYAGSTSRARNLYLVSQASRKSLYDFEEQLLDPKRVRASAAGIRLRRPALNFDR